MNISKIALVTGGSSGIGESTARHLSSRGVGCVITYRSGVDAAGKVVDAITDAGGQAVALQLDAGQSNTFDEFVSRLKEVVHDTWGREQLTYVVNNAGTGSSGATISETTEASFDEIIAVNFKGVFFLCQKLLPLIADGGRIINVGSSSTRYAAGPVAAYAGSKAAVEIFSKYLAQELGPRGITVNSVAPGATDTNFAGGFLKDKELADHYANTVALERIGTPDDPGITIASLLLSDANWINGQRIEASGGENL